MRACACFPDHRLTLHRNPACWASAGYNTQGCAALENALRTCMDKPAPPKEVGSPINYHLNRMRDRVVSQRKDIKPTKSNQ